MGKKIVNISDAQKNSNLEVYDYGANTNSEVTKEINEDMKNAHSLTIILAILVCVIIGVIFLVKLVMVQNNATMLDVTAQLQLNKYYALSNVMIEDDSIYMIGDDEHNNVKELFVPISITVDDIKYYTYMEVNAKEYDAYKNNTSESINNEKNLVLTRKATVIKVAQENFYTWLTDNHSDIARSQVLEYGFKR